MPKGPSAGSHLLVLTACIAPKAGIAELLTRADPDVRLQDYVESMRFWLNLREPSIGGLLFADNSGYPLDHLRHVAQQEAPVGFPVEILSFNHPAPPPTLSYGHSELRLLNEALAASALAPKLPYLMKATGRYRYPTINRLLTKLPQDYQTALDTTGEKPWPWRHRSIPICGFALALFEMDFYHRHVADIYSSMRPAPPWDRRQFVESMLYDRLYPRRNEPGIILRWPCNCEPIGVGANGRNYRSPRRRLRSALRALNRVVMPNLWL